MSNPTVPKSRGSKDATTTTTTTTTRGGGKKKQKKQAGYTQHLGKYLSGYAAGDGKMRNAAESRLRCNKLGDKCAGFTCKGSLCKVRKGPVLRDSPRNEISYLKKKKPITARARSRTSSPLQQADERAARGKLQPSKLPDVAAAGLRNGIGHRQCDF